MSKQSSKKAIQATLASILKDFPISINTNGIPEISECATSEDIAGIIGGVYEYHRVANLQMKMLLGAAWSKASSSKYGSRTEILRSIVGSDHLVDAQKQIMNYAWVYNKWKDHGINWDKSWTWHKVQEPTCVDEKKPMGGDMCTFSEGDWKKMPYIERFVKVYAEDGTCAEVKLDNLHGMKIEMPDKTTGGLKTFSFPYNYFYNEFHDIEKQAKTAMIKRKTTA